MTPELEFYAFAFRIVFGAGFVLGLLMLIGWVVLFIQNERRMRALRRQGRWVSPVFPFGYVDVTPPPRAPWESN